MIIFECAVESEIDTFCFVFEFKKMYRKWDKRGWDGGQECGVQLGPECGASVPSALFSCFLMLSCCWKPDWGLRPMEKTNFTHGAPWWSPPPPALPPHFLWAFHCPDDGNTSVYGESLQIAWRGLTSVIAGVHFCGSSAPHETEVLITSYLPPWLRSPSGDGNYLPVTPGTGGMQRNRA